MNLHASFFRALRPLRPARRAPKERVQIETFRVLARFPRPGTVIRAEESGQCRLMSTYAVHIAYTSCIFAVVK